MLLLDRILSVVAPHSCIVCGIEGKLLCGWCSPDALPPLPSRCYLCQRLTPDSATCHKCYKSQVPRHVWIATDYEDVAKTLIQGFKFDHQRAGAPIVGSAMASALPYLRPDSLIVPVPTASSHIRQRGYDHAELLARQIARRKHLQWSKAVSRLTQSRQVGASRQQRLTQLKDCFMVSKPGLIKNANVLLIDDVVTTGATLEAVTTALKQAGAKTVNAVVFAQKR